MNEAEAIKIIKQPDAQIYDLAPASEYLLHKYIALRASHDAALKILRGLYERKKNV